MPLIGVALPSQGSGKDVPSLPLVALTPENHLTSPILCSFKKKTFEITFQSTFLYFILKKEECLFF